MSLPVLAILLAMAAVLFAVGLSDNTTFQTTDLNVGSGSTIDVSSPVVVAGSSTAPETGNSNGSASLLADTYPAGDDAGQSAGMTGDDLVQPPIVVIVPELPLPPLPEGYVDPDDDGFTPDSPREPINDYMTISGRIVDPWGRGIAGVQVTATQSNGHNIWPAPTIFKTDTDGYYQILFLDGMTPEETLAATFLIHFVAPPAETYGWADEWYNNAHSVADATPVPVGSAGVDAVLMPTGIIKGRVANFSQNCWAEPMSPCFEIFVYDAGSKTLITQSGPDTGFIGNTFTFNTLAAGSYKLLAAPSQVIHDSGEVYDGAFEKTWLGGSDWESATVIDVAPGLVTDVNINLDTPIYTLTSGYPTDQSPSNDIVRQRYLESGGEASGSEAVSGQEASPPTGAADTTDENAATAADDLAMTSD